ncbi:ABC transporter substrate-binding protein [Saccharothrix coeruleofusca]|uniref:ABC transporter substrate-binding protein n=1 Tax=Saccharothrix coeruleofusca TaxID=33919 RepID=A0A918EC87_9PSEU|nr:ABC transporter substrate-binding protein [Saccharothrix coeruleofusca]
MTRVRTALAVVAVVVAAGCAEPRHDPESDGTGPITFVDSSDSSAGQRIADLVEQWNARSSSREQVTFVRMPTATDAYRAQLTSRAQDLAAGRGGQYQSQCYDVVTLDVVWTAEFADAGFLEPLDPAEFDAGFDGDRFLPSAVESVRAGGRTWAVPWRADAGLLYYRADVLAREGLEPPRTWEELAAQARAVAPKHGLAGYVGQFQQFEGLVVNALEAVWAHGGDARDLASPQAKAGVRMLAEGVEQGWIPREALDYSEQEGLREFREGRVLFMRNWPYTRQLFAAPDSPVRDGFAVTALPGVDARPGVSALGGWNLAVSRCSTRQATARAFIRFLTSEASQRELAEQAGFPPTLRSLYQEPELNARLPHLGVLRASVENARNRPQSKRYDELTGVMQRALHNALRNPRSVDAELDRLAADVEDVLSER